MKILRGLSPIARVLLGLALGVLLGVFIGEPAGVLSIGGDIYIRLLQMTVLPYILVSLIVGLGGLDAEMARRIGLRGGGMILVLWAIALATLVCLPLAFPNWISGAFFSASLVEEPTKFDPLTLYIPSNPFYSLANTIVPAVVAFAIMVGLALISVDDKRGLLKGLDNVSDALMKIVSFVGKLAPLGIFVIAASAAGTLRVEELSRLQIFLWAYMAAWCLLTFWVLPSLVAWATPFSFREVLRESQVAMVTGFATGTVLVVLPLIAASCLKSKVWPSNTRCGETSALNRVSGTSLSGLISGISPRRNDRLIPGSVAETAFASCNGWRILLTAARVIRPNQDGWFWGSHGSTSGSASYSGVVLCKALIISCPDAPSMAAW